MMLTCQPSAKSIKEGSRKALRPAGRGRRVTAIFGGYWRIDRKSTRLNSSHDQISYAVFCLKKKNYNRRTVSWYPERSRPGELMLLSLLTKSALTRVGHGIGRVVLLWPSH